MSTQAVVEELLNRIWTESPERIADAYAEEVDWQLDWPEDEHGTAVPWIRRRSSRADVAEHFRTLADNHDSTGAGVDIVRILIDGADAVVLGTLTNTVRHTGKRYSAHFALHLTVDNGLIIRHHVYEDSLSVFRAWRAD